jgi:hypothetical protein
MVDKASLGKAGVPFRLDVERGKILEFALATRSGHPDYLLDEHPVIPPTFLTTILFWQTLVEGANPWALVQMDQQRGMHAEQEYVFFGPPPRAGARLTCISRIETITTKTGRRGGELTFVEMVTEFRDESDKLVAEARLTGVETEK